MNIPKRPFNILPWGDTLLDESLDNWTGEAYDAVEIYLSIKNRGLYQAPATLYTCPNVTPDGLNATVGWLINRARELNLAVILNLDIYMGHGRPDDDKSAPGPGAYHHTWFDGGEYPYQVAVDRILKWPKHLLENVIAFQGLNEPKNVDWLARWIAKNVWQRHGQKFKDRGWKRIGSAKSEHLKEYAHLVDVLDPHGVWDEVHESAAFQRELERKYPNHEQWWTELLENNPEDTFEISKAVIDAGAEAYSVFGGNSLKGDDGKPYFPANHMIWNFNRKHQWAAQCVSGITTAGRELEELRGMDGGNGGGNGNGGNGGNGNGGGGNGDNGDETNYVKRAKARQAEMKADHDALIERHDLAVGSDERVKFRRARAAHRDTVAVTEELEGSGATTANCVTWSLPVSEI